MWREKSTGNIVREGSSWTDANGITHPRTWHIWSSSEKTSAGLEELTPDPIPNRITWLFTQDEAGKVSKTARDLADKTVNGEVQLGVKSTLINEVKHQQGNLLTQSDWAIIRKADKGTAIPSNVQTWRDAIRTKATAMDSAINGAANTAAIEALFLVWDGEGNKSGILYDWPDLVE